MKKKTIALLILLSTVCFFCFPVVSLAKETEDDVDEIKVVTYSKKPWLHDKTNKIADDTSNRIAELNKDSEYYYRIAILDDVNKEFNFAENKKDKKHIIIRVSPQDKQYQIDYNGHVGIKQQERIEEVVSKNRYDLSSREGLNKFVLSTIETIEKSNMLFTQSGKWTLIPALMLVGVLPFALVTTIFYSFKRFM